MVFNNSKKNPINRFNGFLRILVLRKIFVDYTLTFGNRSRTVIPDISTDCIPLYYNETAPAFGQNNAPKEVVL